MEQLKNAIQRKINRTLESPKDFEYLSEQQQQILLDSLQNHTIYTRIAILPIILIRNGD